MNEKLAAFFDRYARRLIASKALPNRASTHQSPPSQAAAYDHVLWMCSEGAKLAFDGKVEKAMRWLGFVQGTLWLLWVYSIDEMRAQTTEAGIGGSK